MESDKLHIDLAFAIDCTISMRPYILNATDRIRQIVNQIKFEGTLVARFALVEYRDYPLEDNIFVTRVQSFTNAEAEMNGWLDQCLAQGGGDTPEAVADALYDILNLSWDPQAVKICILIADAPPHGLHPIGDSFPLGSPAGHDPIMIVRKMAEEKITLHIIGVEPSIIPFRTYFQSLAQVTSGEYISLENANNFGQNIIATVLQQPTQIVPDETTG
ncbi:unnamed protein product [Rotaria magnacalcarata]|nr:unnamed protein product [Rotaria magnacalcarata]CAF1652956.1 unnamed protein product [Rotaria magnacalcarata]CAF2030749.1 unnamed protein product [Rotaria magnacalcarata]